jgi:ABC-type dipeptide/oligopeptide/nickel transport system permease subunit
VIVRALALLGRRLLLLAVLLAAVFAALTFLPRDAAQVTADRGASAAEVAARRTQLGLDQPLVERFARWMAGLPLGDLGTTARGAPVADVVLAALPGTVLLAGLAMILTVLASVTLAGLAALRPGGPLDRIVGRAATVVMAVPEFVVGSVLILVLALWAGLLPAVAVADADGAVVVHCAGGKDRTGLVAALLLRVAGVPIEEIARDYARSEERRAGAPDSWVDAAPDEDERARRLFMQHTPPAAMQRALEQLERDHGSAEAYLAHAGLDEPHIERLRERLRPI